MKNFEYALIKREGVIECFPHETESRVDIIIGVPKRLQEKIKTALNKSLDRILKRLEKEEE